jgi:UDP-N-acetylmuramoyl-tripeptide--D-alanyl-D-alanine ligase
VTDVEVPLTAATVAEAVGGRIQRGRADRPFTGVSIDSRTIRPGQLFIGIRGDRFDGAEYADAALAKGAAGAMVPSGRPVVAAEGAGDAVVIEVDDPVAALQALGRHVRRASGARVTAITGSAGKTTTKEIAAEFLSARFRVFRNEGNLNNHIGLPLSLIELRTRPEMAVVELGMNHAGEIRTLVALAEPEMRVWTNVGDAHIGFFASAEAIADAKAEILERASAQTVAVVNADDARVMARTRGFAGRLVTFGRADTADVRATEIRDRGIDGTSARLRTPAGEGTIEVPLPGIGNLANVMAGAAVALTWGVPFASIAERASNLRPARRRGEVVPLPRGVTLVDDSYNSSPAALKNALLALSRDERHVRRVALLGEMLELGDHAAALHEECGRAAAAAGVAVLVTVGGPAAERLAAAARAAGVPADSVHHVSSSAEAAAMVARVVRPGDVVLVKGSRGVRMDVVADRVRDEWR